MKSIKNINRALKKTIPFLSLSLLTSFSHLQANAEMEELPPASQPVSMVGDLHIDLVEIPLDDSSSSPVNHNASIADLLSEGKVAENIVKTLVVIQDIKEAKSVDEKIDVAVDFAQNIAPEKMEKIDQAIERMSDDKHIKRANEVTNLVEMLLDDAKDKQPHNQNISKASEIVDDIQDILEAKSLADAGKGGVELIEDVKDLIVANESWFSKMKRRLSCYCCVSEQEAIEPAATKPASDIVKEAAAPTE